ANIDVTNDHDSPNVKVTSLTTVGGDIRFEQTDEGIVLVDGMVTSGNGVDGGEIFLKGDNGMTIAAGATVSSKSGAGGQLKVSGAIIDGVIALGLGDITINGGDKDVIINTDTVSNTDVELGAKRDIIINASLEVTGNAKLTADTDNDGVGGFWLRDGGKLTTTGTATIGGSDVFAIPANDNGVQIDADGAGALQIDSQGDVMMNVSTNAPGDNAVAIGGRIQSSAGRIVMTTDDVDTTATGDVSAAQGVGIHANAGQGVNLGGDLAGNVGLTSVDASRLGGAILVDGGGAAIAIGGNFTYADTLHLTTTSTVQGNGDLDVDNLAIRAGGLIDLAGDNDIDQFAADLTDGGADLRFNGQANIGSVGQVGNQSAALAGLTNLNGDVVLSSMAGAITQSAPIRAAGLEILSQGTVDLQNAANDVGTIAANAPGSINYVDSGQVRIGNVNASQGLVSGSDITITADTLVFGAEIRSATRVTLITTGNTIIDQNTTTNDITSVDLVLRATGVGEETNPLETTIDRLAAVIGGGGLYLTNSQGLIVDQIGATDGVTGAGDSIELTANSPLTVNSTISNAGDIKLTASNSGGADDLTLNGRVVVTGDGSIELNAGRDILVNYSGVDPEVFAAGTGPIVFRSEGDVIVGSDVVMGSANGRFETFPTVRENVTLFFAPVDRGGSNIDAAGNASVILNVGLVSETNYRVQIDWHDGTVDDIGGVVGGVNRIFDHRYFGNPNSGNASSDVPVSATIGLDAQPIGMGANINGIQFFINGDFVNQIETTVSRLQVVPGEGIQTYLPPPVTEFVPIESRQRSVIVILVDVASSSSLESDSFDLNTTVIEIIVTDEIRVFFRLVDDATGKEAIEEFDLPPETLNQLLNIFKKYKLPDGHYKIYLEDTGTNQIRLLLDVHVFQGRVVPANFRDNTGEQQPGQDEQKKNDDNAAALEQPLDAVQAQPVHLQRAGWLEEPLDAEQPIEDEANEVAAVFNPQWRRRAVTTVGAAATAAVIAGDWRNRVETAIDNEEQNLSKAARRKRRLRGGQ
ncbi:MAG: hypothetical protein QGG36_18200, partial [Pirellulaceae bacterium]|nr:hypothetical protein [Pirellulaceae bacterium]